MKRNSSNSIKSILDIELKKISPSDEEIKKINDYLRGFVSKISNAIKMGEIDAEIFLGGSFAKNTVVVRNGEEFSYDVDLFIRYDKKYNDKNISEITEKILNVIKLDFIKLHGSRDYFRVNASGNLGVKFYTEIIPVIKVKNPKDAFNITDLSYSHVNYIKRKIKNKKILDDIKLSKQFAYACNSYGAESYIRGFSGYGLELLTFKYGSFLKMLKEISKTKEKEKLIIDIEKHYRNKQSIMIDVNSSKLSSPIILIDPVYKQRNVLAALNDETFIRFKKHARGFLKKPSLKYFEIEKKDINKIKKDSIKKKYEFVQIELKTEKQEGDVAGSKLLKFNNFILNEIDKYFDIKDKGFIYDDKQSAKIYIVAKKEKEILISGPSIEMNNNCDSFKKAHKKTFVKNKRLFAKEKINFGLKDFIVNWKSKNNKIIKDMSVSEFKILNY